MTERRFIALIPTSLCNHKEVWISEFETVCIKCGRIVVNPRTNKMIERRFIIPIHPSLCNHKEVWISEFETVCIKCGRRKIIKEDRHLFYYCNGVQYFTRYLKEQEKTK